jgi:hypothetical protein
MLETLCSLFVRQPAIRRRRNDSPCHWVAAEVLEAKFCLSAIAPGAVLIPPSLPAGTTLVAPSIPRVPPVLLPSGFSAPPGTGAVPPVSGGQLPANLPSLAGVAETIAVTAAASFQGNHPSAAVHVTDHLYPKTGQFVVTVTEFDGLGNDLVYTVSESKLLINVTLTVHDGVQAEHLTAFQYTAGTQYGMLIDASYSNSGPTSVTVDNALNGVILTHTNQVGPLKTKSR